MKDYLEKVVISWMVSDNPKVSQQELLESFKKEHGEYPLWNISKKASTSPQLKPKMAPKVVKSRPARK